MQRHNFSSLGFAEKYVLFLKMPQKPSSPLIAPSLVGGGLVAAGVGAATVAGATINAFTHMKELNADIKKDPNQKYTIDNHVTGLVTVARDSIFATMAGLSAGSTVGGVIGGAAGLSAGKSKKGKLMLGTTGAVIGTVAGGLVAGAATFGALQKRRLNNAKEKSELIVNSAKDLKTMSEGVITSSERIEMVHNVNRMLNFINNTTNVKEEREKLWNALRIEFPLQAPDFEDSSNPVDIYELFEQATVGLQNKKLQKSYAGEIPSVKSLIVQLHNFSQKVIVPPLLSEQEKPSNDPNSLTYWAKNPFLIQDVFDDENNPKVKQRMHLFLHSLDEKGKGVILQSLAGNDICKQHFSQILNIPTSSNLLVRDSIQEKIFNNSKKEVFQEYSSIVATFISQEDNIMAEILSGEEITDHITDLADGMNNGGVKSFFTKVYGTSDGERNSFIDSAKMPDKQRLTNLLRGNENAIYTEFSTAQKDSIKNSLSLSTDPSITQLKENRELLVDELLKDENLMKQLFKGEILSFDSLLNISENKNKIIEKAKQNLILSDSFKKQKITDMLSENPEKVISAIKNIDNNVFRNIYAALPPFSDSFIAGFYNEREADILNEVDENIKETFWREQLRDSPSLLSDFLLEKSSLEIFKSLPDEYQRFIAKDIEDNPHEMGDVLEQAFLKNLRKPLVIGESDNKNSMIALSKLLDNNHISADESSNDDTNNKEGGILNNIITKVKENPVMASVTAKETLDNLKQAREWFKTTFGKKASNDRHYKKAA